MDWASILGDAIGLVMELQKQVKDLQDELEDMAPDNDVTKREDEETNPEGLKPGLDLGDSPEVSMMVASNTKIVASKQPMHGNDDNGQQMENQVEVRQLDANVKVFCEHKQGGFARLLEAMNSLELEVTNVNVMTFLSPGDSSKMQPSVVGLCPLPPLIVSSAALRCRREKIGRPLGPRPRRRRLRQALRRHRRQLVQGQHL